MVDLPFDHTLTVRRVYTALRTLTDRSASGSYGRGALIAEIYLHDLAVADCVSSCNSSTADIIISGVP